MNKGYICDYCGETIIHVNETLIHPDEAESIPVKGHRVRGSLPCPECKAWNTRIFETIKERK